MPPVTIAGISNLIVSDEFKKLLSASGLDGLNFRQVAKTQIVRLDWRSWDLSVDEPEKYPAGNEPENYIERRKHDPALSDELGPIWEVLVEASPDTPHDYDLVRSAPTPFSHLLASTAAAAWFRKNAAEWIQFTART